MPSRQSQPWTVEEDDRLRALVARGASTFRASAALKRPSKSVYQRAQKLGCPFPTIAQSRTRVVVSDVE
jgi:hypothetical protein